MPAPTAVAAIAHELAAYPPFDRMGDDARIALAATVRIQYVDVGEVIFDEGQPTADAFFVVKKGTVELRRRALAASGDAVPADDTADAAAPDTAAPKDEPTPPTDDPGAEWILIDRCDEGDVFGVRPLLAGTACSARAIATEDSLLVVVPWAAFRRIMDSEPAVAAFFAAGFAAELPRRFERLLDAGARARRAATSGGGGGEGGSEGDPGVAAPPDAHRLAANENDYRLVEPVRDVATCPPTTTIRDVAAQMTVRDIGSLIVVDDARRPVGIVTDSDLRRRVLAAGLDPDTTTVEQIMASPVRTVSEDRSVSELIGLVLRHRVHHFVVTEDGTPDTPLTGIVSEHDILTTQGSHPTVLLNEMLRTTDVARLRDLRDRAELLLRSYLEQEVAIEFVTGMMTEVNDVLVRQSIAAVLEELADEGVAAPTVPFCWLALGSEGRCEQLLRTDQDNALIYEDPPESSRAAVQQFFLTLGERVVERLVGIGFAPCPGNMMASNPEWNQSRTEWERTFGGWIATPGRSQVMHTNIFFDLRAGHGDADLADGLRRFIFERLDRDRTFLTMFAAEALRNPAPLGFFRNFIVEKSGEHAEQFDIKARAMMPLSDAARVLCYELRLPVDGGTFARYDALARAIPERAELFEEASMAYGILLRLRAREGLRDDDSGRYVDIQRLNKLERQTVRNTFNVIGEMQRFLRLRFQLDRVVG